MHGHEDTSQLIQFIRLKQIRSDRGRAIVGRDLILERKKTAQWNCLERIMCNIIKVTANGLDQIIMGDLFKEVTVYYALF